MTPLAAADLDRTLIFSRAALGDAVNGPIRCVEHHDGEPASWLTEAAAHDVAALADAGSLVPVTTRTQEQYARVALPGGPSRWAVCANGGIVVVDLLLELMSVDTLVEARKIEAELRRERLHRRRVTRSAELALLTID